MTRIPTTWTTNASRDADSVLYSSASVLYSSPTTFYTSSTSGESILDKPYTSWNQFTKLSTTWTDNPKFTPVAYSYDGGLTYDTFAPNYDGIAAGQSPISTKPKTTWEDIF